jgi:hypothetical protein
LEWVPKSAGNAFLAVEIFHFRLPDSRWHLVLLPDSFMTPSAYTNAKTLKRLWRQRTIRAGIGLSESK